MSDSEKPLTSASKSNKAGMATLLAAAMAFTLGGLYYGSSGQENDPEHGSITTDKPDLDPTPPLVRAAGNRPELRHFDEIAETLKSSGLEKHQLILLAGSYQDMDYATIPPILLSLSYIATEANGKNVALIIESNQKQIDSFSAQEALLSKNPDWKSAGNYTTKHPTRTATIYAQKLGFDIILGIGNNISSITQDAPYYLRAELLEGRIRETLTQDYKNVVCVVAPEVLMELSERLKDLKPTIVATRPPLHFVATGVMKESVSPELADAAKADEWISEDDVGIKIALPYNSANLANEHIFWRIIRLTEMSAKNAGMKIPDDIKTLLPAKQQGMGR